MVSIGVPVHNEEVYLPETLDSLLDQDLEDFELIISDNASTDLTPDICADYALRDQRVRWHRNDYNRGGAYNYNKLVHMAAAPLFKWASGNDLCDPTLLRRCVEALHGRDDAVLAYPQTLMINAIGEPLWKHESDLDLVAEEPWERLRHFVQRRHMCNPVFGVIRTDALHRTKLIRPATSSDISLLAELAVAGKFTAIPEPLLFRRVLPESCGLGDLTRDEVAEWFLPGRRALQVPPGLRILVEVELAILTQPSKVSDRLRSAGVFGYEWTKNRAAVRLWQYRRDHAATRPRHSASELDKTGTGEGREGGAGA